MLMVCLVMGGAQISYAKPPEPEAEATWWWTTSGGISQYDLGVMRGVIMVRTGWGQLPSLPEGIEKLSNEQFWEVVEQEWGVKGAVALRECEIGRVIWLRAIGGDWEPLLCVDCGSKTDSRWQDGLSGYAWMVTRGVLAEVDGYTALRGGYYGQSAHGSMLGDP